MIKYFDIYDSNIFFRKNNDNLKNSFSNDSKEASNDSLVKEASNDSLIKEALWPSGKHRKRIRDRGINWKEAYHERSEPLKKRFTKDIGEGSYYRFEGYDYHSSGDYFVVIGPSIQRNGKKSFFAGIKRLPPKHRRKKIYATSGKYFNSIISAISYANRMWGTPFPKNQPHYSEADLVNVNIPRKIKG